MLNIVLYEPEIPANTGNIGRTCVATGTRLHLIEPLGFRLNEKSLKRAGMDYWKDLDVTTYIDYQDFLEKNPGAKIYMATTKAHKVYTEVDYESDCYIMFGKESAGIPEEILVEHEEDCMRIPMNGDIRSLNLGNSVAIVLYEAGSYLVLTEHGEETLESLKNAGVPAVRIGFVKEQNARTLVNGEETRYLDRPAPDELSRWRKERKELELCTKTEE